MEYKKLKISHIPNARELGGYVLPGGRVREGLLLRGGFLNKISQEDIDILRDSYHLRRVVDFRTAGEVSACPDPEMPGVENIHLPAIDPNTEKVAGMSLPKEAFKDLPGYLVSNAGHPMVQAAARNLYLDLVSNEYTQLQYSAFLQEIINTDEGSVYWHCSQGKDRTGLGAAFLLAALGADRKLIMEDYLISAEYYREEYNACIGRLSREDEAEFSEKEKVVRTFISVNEEYFSEALDLIDRRFGSMRAYLEGPLCMTPRDFEILKNRYLEKI